MVLQNLFLLFSMSALVHSLHMPQSDDSSKREGGSVDKHVTYVALSGGGDHVLREMSLSVFSLCRLHPSVRVLVITDEEKSAVAKEAISKISEACWNTTESEKLSMVVVNRPEVQSFFSVHNYTNFGHHSGLGGYAKIFVQKIIPASIDRTIVLDTDTVFNSDIEELWSQFDNFGPGQVLAGKKLGEVGSRAFKCIKGGNRINSGVVLMDLKRMRSTNWADFVVGEGKKCSECVGQHGTMLCGDQEFVSFGCQQRSGACAGLDGKFNNDYAGAKRRWADNSANIVIYHFNGHARVFSRPCPGIECRAAIKEWKSLFCVGKNGAPKNGRGGCLENW